MNDYEQQQVYGSQEVSEILGIADSTLRRWCLLLEKNGYTFLRGDNGQRAFRDHDLFILRRLREYSKQKNMKIENAVHAVISSVQQAQKTVVVHDNSGKGSDMNSVHEAFIKRLEKYENLIAELLKRLDERDRQFEEAIRRQEEAIRRRDEMLIAAIRQIAETQKQLAAAREEKGKPFWKRLFRL